MYPRKTQATMNKFHVFTAGKNTRNRQLIYFYIPPYVFCRSRSTARVIAVFVLGGSRLFPRFFFAIETIFRAIAPYIVLKRSKVLVQN